MDRLETGEQLLLDLYRQMNDDFKLILLEVAKQNATASDAMRQPILLESA